MVKDEAFASWAIVEVLGRKQFAGHVSEQVVAGQALLRVDVPETTVGNETIPAFTKFVGPGSIYMLTPTDEATARRVAAALRERPVHVWQMPEPRGALRDPDGSLDPDYNPDSDQDLPDDLNEICGDAHGTYRDGSTRECQLEPGHAGNHAAPEPEDLDDVTQWPQAPKDE